MPKLNGKQIGLLAGAIILGVTIYFAPHHASSAKVEKVDRTVDAKINKAIELVNGGGHPMQGIMLLREVLEENPDNVRANFQMGLFSIQSQQFDKALQRFEKVLSVEPDNYEAQYFRGHAKASVGDFAGAENDFKSVMKNASDQKLIDEASNFYNELKNK